MRIIQISVQVFALQCALLVGTVSNARALDWGLEINASNKTCAVLFKVRPSPPGFKNVGYYETRKLACSDAVATFDSTNTDPGKCWWFTKDSRDTCLNENIVLPIAAQP